MLKIRHTGVGLLCLFGIMQLSLAQSPPVMLQIHFSYRANGKPLILGDSVYTNPFGEAYRVNRLKFYMSNAELYASAEQAGNSKSIFLIDAASTDSISLPIRAGTYNELRFSIGVDSLQNVSGAEAGALDPLNGMYWTWHSGYIFFKLEGSSGASTADLNRIEHHIGGYHGPNKAQRIVTLPLPTALMVQGGRGYRLNIELNLDKYWQSGHAIKIAEVPLVMAPGEPAKKCAENLAAAFSIIP